MLSISRYLNSDRQSDTFESHHYEKGKPNRDFSLNADRKGFVITFEIMMTVIMMATVMLVTTYFVNIYQTQRYFAEITASTCTMASRYGGNDSAAYKIQVGNGGNIQENAQAQLNAISHNNSVFGDDFHATIKVDNHPDAKGEIGVTLSYRLSDYGWIDLAQNLGLANFKYTQTFRVPSIMSVGKLT